MAQHIAQRPYGLPRLIRGGPFRLAAQPARRLAYDQQGMKDCKNRLLIVGKGPEIQARRESLYPPTFSRMSSRRRISFSEGKDRLFLDLSPQPLLADRLGDEIDRTTENVAQALDQ